MSGLDLTEEIQGRYFERLRPSDTVSPGVFEGFVRGTGMHAMRGFAKTAAAVDMVGALPAIIQDRFTGGTTAQDKYFKEHDDLFGSAIDFWTPKPNEVGIAGQVFGELLHVLPTVMLSPSLAVGATQMGTAEELVKMGVDPAKAQAVAGIQGGGLGLGIWVPIYGRSLWERMLVGGAGFNVAQGAAMRAASEQILKGTPAEHMFKAMDPAELTIDLLLGLAFGGMAHLSPEARQQGKEGWEKIGAFLRSRDPRDRDALLALRQAQHINVDTLPGRPVSPADQNAHTERVKTALEQMVRDQPINVQDIKVTEEMVTVYHATTPEEAASIRATGLRPDSHVAMDEGTAWMLREMTGKPGDEIVELQVPKSSLTPDETAAMDGVEGSFQYRPREAQREPAYEPVARDQEAQAQGEAILREAETVRREQDMAPPPDPEVPLEQRPVYRAVRESLEAVGRFGQEEHHAYSKVTNAFYEAMSRRMGVTPEDLLAQYPLRVSGGETPGTGALAQPGEGGYGGARGQGPLRSADARQEPEVIQSTVGGGRPAQGWIGATRVSRNGRPVALHRGSARPLSAGSFSQERLGGSTGHASSGLGVFFSPSEAHAAKYGTPYAYYVDIRNPKRFNVEDLPGFESVAEAFAFREQLRAQGFDGIAIKADHLGGDNVIIAFHPDQVMSASPERLFQSGGKAPRFYSELERQVTALKLEAGTAEQWKGTLKNLKGVKKDEIEWSGINEWLDLQAGDARWKDAKWQEPDAGFLGYVVDSQGNKLTGLLEKREGEQQIALMKDDAAGAQKITKQQVLDFLEGNGVKVTETLLGTRPDGKKPMEDRIEEALRAEGYRTEEDPGGMPGEERLIFDQNNELIDFEQLPQHLQDLINRETGNVARATSPFDDPVIAPDRALIEQNGWAIRQEETEGEMIGFVDPQTEDIITASDMRRFMNGEESDPSNGEGGYDPIPLEVVEAAERIERRWHQIRVTEETGIDENTQRILQLQQELQNEGWTYYTDDNDRVLFNRTEGDTITVMTPETMRANGVTNAIVRRAEEVVRRIAEREPDLETLTDRLSNLGWNARPHRRMDGSEGALFQNADGNGPRGALSVDDIRALPSLDPEVVRLAEQIDSAMSKDASEQVLPTKFGQYTLPGGENYRELLLTLPEKTPMPQPVDMTGWKVETVSENRYTGQREIVIRDALGNVVSQRSGFRGTDPDAIRDLNDRMNESLQVDARRAQQFTSSHFDQPNILAHVRFNDRTDADGKKVLFIEEIQSDWAQQGKRRGFTGQEERLYAVYGDGDTEPRARFNTHEEASRYVAEHPGERLREALLPKKTDRVAAAPFVTKTDAWVGLAVKRMIAWAVENGYDRVAWTRGEQQVERYTGALRKAVDEIEWTKTDKGVQLVGYKGKGPRRHVPSETVAQPIVERAYDALARNDMLGFDTAPEAIEAIWTHREDWENRWEVPDNNDAGAINRYIRARRTQESNNPVQHLERQLEQAKHDRAALMQKFREIETQVGYRKLLGGDPRELKFPTDAREISANTGVEQSDVTDAQGHTSSILLYQNGYIEKRPDGTYYLNANDFDAEYPRDMLHAAERDLWERHARDYMEPGDMEHNPMAARYNQLLQQRDDSNKRIQEIVSDLQNARDARDGDVRNPRTKVVDTTEREDALSDAIGKSMADRILNDPAQSGTIEGENIRIDDTGMAGFYDRIVPKIANDILKKMGGGKVGEVKIDVQGRPEAGRGLDAVRIYEGPEYSADGVRAVRLEQHDIPAEIERQLRDIEAAIRAGAGTNEAVEQHGSITAARVLGGDLKPRSKVERTQPGFEITPEMRKNAIKGQALFQGENRGFFEFGKDGQPSNIGMLADADRSTFIHESGHFFLDVTLDLGRRRDAPPELKRDIDTMFKWWGVKRSEWDEMSFEEKRPFHEQFARGFEKYLAEGKAPTEDLRSVFERFKDWLLEVYRTLTSLNVRLNDDIRAVMGRMLGAPTERIELPRERATEARSSLLEDIRKLGGIEKAAMLDITGERRGGKGIKGIRAGLFTNQGRGLDDLAISLRDMGWPIPDDPVDGGTQALRDLIREEIEGSRAVREGEEGRSDAEQKEDQAEDVMAQYAELEAEAAERHGFMDTRAYRDEVTRIRNQRDNDLVELFTQEGDPVAAEARRTVLEAPDQPMVVGTKADGTNETVTARAYLDEAEAEYQRAIEESKLYNEAAACLMGNA